MASLSNADNFVQLSGSHHVSNGRWPDRSTAEFYSASQPRDKGGRWTRLGGRGFAPNQLGQQARSDYRQANGISHFAPPSDFSGVVVDPAARARAARAYLRMPSADPKAIPAYESLRAEVKQQYDYMTKKLGIKVVTTKEDPYATVEEMMDDINNNKTLKVMSTASTGGHPFFSNEENDMFRAVHDFFGHGATGRDFSRHGERASYLSHASMMKNEDSIRALFTETEMQNAALIKTGQFQEQKIGLAPDSMVFDGLQRANGVQASAAVFACYEKACAPPPAGSGGSSAGRGVRMSAAGVRNAANILKEPDGGFTLSTRLQPIEKGFAVALNKSDKLIHSKDLFDADGNPNPKLTELIKDRLAAATKTRIPKGTEVALGGWHNPKDGKVEINVTVVFPPNERSRAFAFAQKQNQLSMAQLDPFEIIETGGTGGDRAVTASATPADKALYARVKAEAKRKFDVYPSAYANGWLAQEYKRRGGKYLGKKSTVTGLKKWFKEDWVDISRPKEGGGFEPCGRSDASEGKYPKCVPASVAARMTPEEIESAVRRKRRAESTEDREGKKPINVATFAAKKPVLKDPRGGLTPAGRKAFGGNLKPGVKDYDNASVADKKRWISWARRFYARDSYPPFVDEDGNPTRFALTARAWGEPVPKTAEDARKIAAKAAMRAEKLKAEQA